VPALPGTSANARAETLNANIKLTSAVTDRLRLNATYTHDNRDNQTPRPHTPPFPPTCSWCSQNQHALQLYPGQAETERDYRIATGTKGAVGIDYDSRKRTFQEVDKTPRIRSGERSTQSAGQRRFDLQGAHGERSASGYKAVPLIAFPENPLLRKFYLANRTRDTAGLRADIGVTEKINVGLGVDSSKDDYSDSSIGLTSGNDLSLNGDVSMALTETTSVTVFAVRQEIKSKQSGSQIFAGPDWTGETKDTIDTVGIGVKHVAIKDKLDIGPITWSRAHVAQSASAPVRQIPDSPISPRRWTA